MPQLCNGLKHLKFDSPTVLFSVHSTHQKRIDFVTRFKVAPGQGFEP